MHRQLGQGPGWRVPCARLGRCLQGACASTQPHNQASTQPASRSWKRRSPDARAPMKSEVVMRSVTARPAGRPQQGASPPSAAGWPPSSAAGQPPSSAAGQPPSSTRLRALPADGAAARAAQSGMASAGAFTGAAPGAASAKPSAPAAPGLHGGSAGSCSYPLAAAAAAAAPPSQQPPSGPSGCPGGCACGCPWCRSARLSSNSSMSASGRAMSAAPHSSTARQSAAFQLSPRRRKSSRESQGPKLEATTVTAYLLE